MKFYKRLRNHLGIFGRGTTSLSILDKLFMSYMRKMDPIELDVFATWIAENVRFVTDIPVKDYNMKYECNCEGFKTYFYPHETDSKYLLISTNAASIKLALERNVEYLPYFKFKNGGSKDNDYYKFSTQSLPVLFLVWLKHQEDDRLIYINLPLMEGADIYWNNARPKRPEHPPGWKRGDNSKIKVNVRQVAKGDGAVQIAIQNNVGWHINAGWHSGGAASTYTSNDSYSKDTAYAVANAVQNILNGAKAYDTHSELLKYVSNTVKVLYRGVEFFVDRDSNKNVIDEFKVHIDYEHEIRVLKFGMWKSYIADELIRTEYPRVPPYNWYGLVSDWEKFCEKFIEDEMDRLIPEHGYVFRTDFIYNDGPRIVFIPEEHPLVGKLDYGDMLDFHIRNMMECGFGDHTYWVHDKNISDIVDAKRIRDEDILRRTINRYIEMHDKLIGDLPPYNINLRDECISLYKEIQRQAKYLYITYPTLKYTGEGEVKHIPIEYKLPHLQILVSSHNGYIYQLIPPPRTLMNVSEWCEQMRKDIDSGKV